MKIKVFFILIALLFILTTTQNARELPSVNHYSLHISFLLKDEQIKVNSEITVKNETGKTVSEVPFLLYRLLKVKSATNEKSVPLTFSQQTVTDADWQQFQINQVKVKLKNPLAPNGSTKIRLNYEGFIYGYPEVMAYVRESISEQYAFMRQETFSYPIIALANEKSRLASYNSIFTYDLRVIVPEGYIAATGGQLLKTETQNGSSVFTFKSKIPIGQIDIAVAKFVVTKDEPMKLTAFVLPGHEQGADNALEGAKNAITFYSKKFGEIENYQGYTVIEIPEDWGSQAPPLYILQTAAVFQDKKNLVEIYHEVAHSWNVKPKPEIQRTRYFDEAFAVFFAALARGEFEGKQTFFDEMESARKSFIKRTEKDRKNYETPISDYGKYEIGGLSYSKGAWSLYVLHQILGDETFSQAVQSFLKESSGKTADFKDFQRIFERVSKKDLSKFFAEWIYGNESSRLLVENVPIEKVAERYK